MRNLSILAVLLMAVTASSHAATAWKSGEMKDADGNTVCIYKAGLKKVYQSPDFGTICPITIEVNDD